MAKKKSKRNKTASQTNSISAVETLEACFEAVTAKDVKRLKELLVESELDINAPMQDDESGYLDETLLTWACGESVKHLPSVRALIKLGADPNARSNRVFGFAPLHLAATPTIVRTLLEAGAKPNIKSTSGNETPLGQEVIVCQPKSVQALLEAGARPNTKSEELTAVELAAVWNAESCERLLAAGAKPTARVLENAFTPEIYNDRKVREHQTRIVNAMLEAGYKPKIVDLLQAAGDGNLEVVKQLIDEGVPYNKIRKYDLVMETFETPLLMAVLCGHEAIAKFLLEIGADPNLSRGGDTALKRAADSGDLKMAKLLVKHGADATLLNLDELTSDIYKLPEKKERTLKWLEKQGSHRTQPSEASKTGNSNQPRCFHLNDGKSDKFWEITQSGSKMTVRYGKTGTKGQSKAKTFSSKSEREKESEKLIRQKVKKGYIEQGADSEVDSSEFASVPKSQFMEPAMKPIQMRKVSEKKVVEAAKAIAESMLFWAKDLQQLRIKQWVSIEFYASINRGSMTDFEIVRYEDGRSCETGAEISDASSQIFNAEPSKKGKVNGIVVEGRPDGSHKVRWIDDPEWPTVYHELWDRLYFNS